MYRLILMFFFMIIVFFMSVFIKRYYFLDVEISPEYCISQYRMKDIYNLEVCSGGVLVNNVFGWVVMDDYIYGSTTDGPFFIVSQSRGDVRFHTSRELNAVLNRLGLNKLDMSSETTVAHLRYGSNGY